MSNEIEVLVKNLPKMKRTGLDKFTDDLYFIREELTPMFFKLFYKI
jgi:hypothetical protein